MATNPRFTATFDLRRSENYGDFIADLRRRLGNPKHFCHNRPVLPPEAPPGAVPPPLWFHVELTTEAAALTLATRADNLYLEGFRSRDGTWWELTAGYIPGATHLGFGGSYPNLLGETDNLVDVPLGPGQLTEAVNVLAALTRGRPTTDAKKAVAVVLLMVHEATRLLTMSEFVAGLMHPRRESKIGYITAQLKAQVNNWADLSEAMLRTDALLKTRHKGSKSTAELVSFTPFKEMDVITVEQAAATVGILKFVEVSGGMTAAKALQLFQERR